MEEIFVRDLRPPNDGSRGAVPLTLQTVKHIISHFAPIKIDRTHGWEATPAGQACWKLIGFHVTVGPVVINVQVWDETGKPLVGKKVNWHYPYNPQDSAADLHPVVSGRTEVKGIEFQISNEHWAWSGHLKHPDLPAEAPGNEWIEAKPGPNSIWIEIEPGEIRPHNDSSFYNWVASGAPGPQYSDIVQGLGMRGGTDHMVLNPIFQYTIKAGDTTPPVTTLAQTLIDAGKNHIMRLDVTAALFKVAQEKNLGQRLTPEYKIEFEGQTYVAQVYQYGLVYAVEHDWGNVQVIHHSDW